MCFLIETVPVRMMCIPMVVAEAWHIVVTPLGGGNTRGPTRGGGVWERQQRYNAYNGVGICGQGRVVGLKYRSA